MVKIRRTNLCFGVVALASLWLCLAHDEPMSWAARHLQTSRQDQIQRAEETADRFLRRFQETLDFGVPYHQFFVTDPLLRASLSGTDSPAVQAFTEKVEIASMNVWYLQAAYFFAHGEDLPPEIKAARGGDLLPYMDTLNHSYDDPPDVQAKKWENYFRDTEHLAGLFRDYLSGAVFASPAYKERVEKVDGAAYRSRRVPRVEKGFRNQEAFKERDIFIVQRAGFEYYLVEEKGSLRVIHINPIPGFRMAP